MVPRIILPESEQALIVTEGDNITCTATGYPEPYIAWLSDNESVVDKDSIISVMAEGVDSLFNVSVSMIIRRSDGGLYTCLASNLVGNDTSIINITVQCKLSLKLFYQNCNYLQINSNSKHNCARRT